MKTIYIVKPSVIFQTYRVDYETYLARLTTTKRKTTIKYTRLMELLNQFPKLEYCRTKNGKEAIFPTKSARNKVSAYIKKHGITINEMKNNVSLAFIKSENEIRLQNPKKKFIDILETNKDDDDESPF